MPGYGQCKCGKIWNRYVIGTGSDTRTATPEKFIAREVPVRDGVIVANRTARLPMEIAPDSWQGQFATDLADGVPDTEDHARLVNWFNRWKNMTLNERGQYRPGPEVEGHQDYHVARTLLAEADGAAVVEGEFADWLMSQGTSLEALRANPRELQNKLDEFVASRGRGDDPAELMQYLGFRKGAPFAGYDDFDDCTSEHSDKGDPSAYCGEIKHRTEDKHGAFTPGYWDDEGYWVKHHADMPQEQFAPGESEEDYLTQYHVPGSGLPHAAAYTGYDDEAPEPFRAPRERQRSRSRAPLPPTDTPADPRIPSRQRGLGWEARGMDDDQLGNATFRHVARGWYNPVTQGNGINVEVLSGPGWYASVDPSGSWSISRPDASVLTRGRAGGPVEAKGLVEQHLTRAHAPGFHQAAMPFAVGPRWHGKTPGGPQGSGTEGLKQKTRYKHMSTPYLRALQQRMMTTQNTGRIDPNELLRELSFREVLGALHDLDAPGGTPESDGTDTARTDPTMSAPRDWSRRDKGGKWTRGDGHVA